MLIALSSGAQTALIAAGASILTACVTAAAATYSARTRIREVRLTYHQKLHETYLATARQYTTSIYVPLGIALTRLSAAFRSFRDRLDSDTRAAMPDVRGTFVHAVQVFLDEIETLTRQGADAFMTSALEEQLISFAEFLRNSLSAEGVRASVVLESVFTAFGVSLGTATTKPMSGRTVEGLTRLGDLSIGFPGVARASYRTEKLVEAPITSEPFERRMVEDLAVLRELIKEVTLGTQAGPSA
jgi:hypothetical protein